MTKNNKEENELWRNRYMQVDDSNREALAIAGKERREKQRQQKNKLVSS